MSGKRDKMNVAIAKYIDGEKITIKDTRRLIEKITSIPPKIIFFFFDIWGRSK